MRTIYVYAMPREVFKKEVELKNARETQKISREYPFYSSVINFFRVAFEN